MRRILPVLFNFILPLILTVGCSRQPKPHVGEWRGELFLVGEDTPRSVSTWQIYKDGTLQVVSEPPLHPKFT